MIIIAAFFYLPGHVAEMLRRAWFYYAGDETITTPGGGGRVDAVRVGAEVVRGNQRMGEGPGVKMDGQEVMDMLGTL